MHSQVEELRTVSMLSDMPVGEWITVNGSPMALVAVDRWVLPQQCFVMLWFWLNMGARLYVGKFDHVTWNPLIAELNSHQLTGDLPQDVQLLERIYSWSNRKLLMDLPSSSERIDVFCDIVDHLDRTAPVEQSS